MVKKKRHHFGSKNGYSKLNENKIVEIRNLYKTGKYTQKQLSKEYNVNYTAI